MPTNTELLQKILETLQKSEKPQFRTEITNVFNVVSIDKRVESNCLGISFYNQGDTDVVINNGLILKVGDPMFSIIMDEGIIDRTEYNVVFDKPYGVNPQCLVILIKSKMFC